MLFRYVQPNHNPESDESQTLPILPPKFVVRPQNIHVTKGTPAVLTCEVEGEPPPSVQWTKGSSTIRHGAKYKVSSIGEEHSLEISCTARDDTDQYTCILCNIAGTTSAIAQVTVGDITHSESLPTDFRAVLKNRTQPNVDKCNGAERDALSSSSDSNVFLKRNSAPAIYKTGRVNQVDFRGVLKNRNNPNNNSSSNSSKNLGSNSSKNLGSNSSKNSGVLESGNTRTLTRERGPDLPSGPSSVGSLSRKFVPNSDHSSKHPCSTVQSEKLANNRDKSRNFVKDSEQSSKLLRKPNQVDLTNKTASKGSVEPTQVANNVDKSKEKPLGERRNSKPLLKLDFEKKSKVGNSVHTVSDKSKSNGKVNKVLQKFENDVTNTKQEYRSAFKPVQSNSAGVSSRLRQLNMAQESEDPIVKAAVSRLNLEPEPDAVVKPKFDKYLEDQSVTYGSKVMMKCEVTGTPEPDIRWTMNDKEIKQSKFFKMSYGDHVAELMIAEAFSEDEGEYSCRATNNAGSATTACCLHVQDQSTTSDDTMEEPFSPTATPPKVYNISPSEFCILRGGTIEFKASYASVPTGTVTWSKNKREITSGDRWLVDTSEHFSTLTITDIQPGDSGRFDLTVRNKLGSDTSFASLTVQDVPEPPVGQPWVNNVTLTSVTLSWYGPAYDGGCSVTNYRVEICDAEDREWIPVTSTCKDTTYQIDNLTPSTPYFFRIFAENKHGVSQPCQTTDVTVTTEQRPTSLIRQPSAESDDEIPFEHRAVEMQPGRVFEDHYNCLQEVGKGKFGSVYKCEEKTTGKIWAAKILKCREADKKKLRLEVEVMNQLKHPKILLLWDVFEAPRKMILIMEYIGGGELFERVLDDDFELTERDCIQFMRQICDGVNYMHEKNILHLDLKPENILCVKNESNRIKIIDFGLARFYKPGESTRVLFGTPEFIAPEVVNYDEIGFTTDMWSIGVICYVLLTGLSPFMGDSDAETLANVTQGEFDFEDESFDNVSEDGKNYIDRLLVKNKRKRMTCPEALKHKWLAEDAARLRNRKINTKNLKRFMARRKWQKTGNAIRALGRMTALQKLTRNVGVASSSPLNSGSGSASATSNVSAQGSSSAITDNKHASTELFKVSEAEESGASQSEIAADVRKLDNSRDCSNGQTDDRTKVDINANNRLRNITDSDSAFVSHSRHSANQRTGCDSSGVNSSNQNSGHSDRQNASTNQHLGGVLENARPARSCKDCGSVSQHRNSKSDRQTIENRSRSRPLEFKKEMVDSKAFPGDAVRFDVEYTIDPDINIYWFFEDETIRESPRHNIQEGRNGTCSLIIKDVCEEDDGEYSCRIENSSEEKTCSAELIVYGAI